MATTKDGKHKSSKFRASRYDREQEREPKSAPPSRSEGPRAQMHSMQGRGQGNPETAHGGMGEGEPDGDEQQSLPAMHEEIKGVVAEHGPAHTIHMTHDHQNMRSHVHSVHMDGHTHHADHAGEMHHVNAHHHAMHAAGIPQEHIHGGAEDASGNYPAENEPPGEESYGEPL